MMPRPCLLLLLVLLPGLLPEAPAQAVAVIEGTVHLAAAAKRPVSLPRYPGQAIQPSPPEPPTAVVYLDGNFPTMPANSARPMARVEQRGLQFIPNLLPIQVGTTVEFPNHDDLFHNVFSYSKPRRFDLGRYSRNEKPAAQRFDKPGVIVLSCEIHAHMRGHILVLETPYFSRTDTNGHFRLTGLPEGRFTLKAWVNEKTTVEQPVELKAGQTLRIDFPTQ